jgi:hypothetical protein
VRPSDGGEDGRKRNNATPKIQLTIDDGGYPVLPSWDAIDKEGLMYRKLLIGNFMSEMYSE